MPLYPIGDFSNFGALGHSKTLLKRKRGPHVKINALTVFYDGGCPLCSREINHYRKLSADIPIQWLDVTASDAGLERFGLDRDQALKRFHVLDDHGAFHVGAYGFITLWRQLPYYRTLAFLTRALRVAPWLEAVYVRFADWHYRRRCIQGVCGMTEGGSAD